MFAPDDLDEMKKYCRSVDVVKLNKLYFIAMLILGVFSPFPSQVLCYRSLRMAKIIKKYLSNNSFDLVHIVCGRLAGYKKYTGTLPAFIDWIDALSMSTERMFRTESFLPKKIMYYLEWKKMKHFEESRIDKFDYSIITSEVDNKYLSNKFNEVVSNGVDIQTYYPVKDTKKEIDLIFTGNMGYFPNIKAVEFFCERVMPVILKERPETTFYVVGINPHKSVLRYHDNKNIFVTGFVENLTELLNHSRAFVAPLQSGAGIQNKILEAMACSIPVISTTFGNAGIQARGEDEIIIRNDPVDIAEAVLSLLSDTKRSDDIGRNEYSLVKNKFSWDSKVNRLNEIYSEMTKI